MPHRARLLVLPFINLSGDLANDYFCDAITDEVITELAAISPEALAVIARTTAMHYKGSHKDVGRIGHELAIDYVLEGGVRTSNSQIGINVQLIQVSDQAHVFAKKYETELRDIFDVQSAIAQVVAAHIGVNLSADGGRARPAARRATRKLTDDLVAYDAYIRGRSLLGSWTAEDLTKAKQFFEVAIAATHSLPWPTTGLPKPMAGSPSMVLCGQRTAFRPRSFLLSGQSKSTIASPKRTLCSACFARNSITTGPRSTGRWR